MLAEKHRKKPEENRYKKDILVKQQQEKIKIKEETECTFQPNLEGPITFLSPRPRADTRLYDEAIKKKTFKKPVKTTEEINAEKNKEHCTFVPKVRVWKGSKSPTTSSRQSKQLQIDIERLKKGREEKDRVKMVKERGITLNDKQSKKIKESSLRAINLSGMPQTSSTVSRSSRNQLNNC